MAKTSDDDNDQFDRMDEESLQFLEQVRKGKSRYFVMSVKGAKVQSLLVKKKRIKDKELKAARGGGYQPMFGVVEGQGTNISFKIAMSDGFMSDPLGGKVAKLKAFLKDQTGKAFKPTVEVVAEPPPLPFDEDDLKHPLIARFMSLSGLVSRVSDQFPDAVQQLQTLVNETHQLLQDEDTIDSAGPKIDELEKFLGGFELGPTGSAEDETGSTTPPAAPAPERSVLAGKLAEGLKKLKPAVQEAITIAPDRKQVLVSSMAVVVEHIKAENLDEAKVSMVALGKLIQEIRGAASPTDDVPPAPPAPPVDNTAVLATKLAEALKKLKPAADQIIQGLPETKGELYGEIAQIAGLIKSKEFEAAKQRIAEFAPRLKELQQQAGATVETDDAESQRQFRQRQQALEASFLEACRVDFEQKSKLQIDWNAAETQANQNDLATANQTLDRLEKAIQTILSTEDPTSGTGIEQGTVEKRSFLATRFQQIPVEIQPHLESVKTRIIEQDADGNPEELIGLLESALQELFDELQDEIDESITAGDSRRIAGLKSRVTSNPVVQHLVQNPFVDGSRFQSAIMDALDEVEQKLVG